MLPLLASMVGQWLAAAASIWLTWWAAQSRDALPLRIGAMTLVVVPALLWPAVTVAISMDQTGAVTSRAFLFGVLSAGVSLLRAIFLGVWATVSNDSAHLRIGGAVTAGLLVVSLALGLVGLVVAAAH